MKRQWRKQWMCKHINIQRYYNKYITDMENSQNASLFYCIFLPLCHPFMAYLRHVMCTFWENGTQFSVCKAKSSLLMCIFLLKCHKCFYFQYLVKWHNRIHKLSKPNTRTWARWWICTKVWGIPGKIWEKYIKEIMNW